MNRRDFLKTTGALAGGLALTSLTPNLVHASLTLGSIKISTLSDGTLGLPGDMVYGHLPQDELAPILKKHDLDLICRAHQVVEDGYEFFAKR